MKNTISGDQWPADVPLSEFEPRFTCHACGTKGADLRPNFPVKRRSRSDRTRAYARAYTITANATAIKVTPIHTTDATSERMVRRDWLILRPPSLIKIKDLLHQIVMRFAATTEVSSYALVARLIRSYSLRSALCQSAF